MRRTEVSFRSGVEGRGATICPEHASGVSGGVAVRCLSAVGSREGPSGRVEKIVKKARVQANRRRTLPRVDFVNHRRAAVNGRERFPLHTSRMRLRGEGGRGNRDAPPASGTTATRVFPRDSWDCWVGAHGRVRGRSRALRLALWTPRARLSKCPEARGRGPSRCRRRRQRRRPRRARLRLVPHARAPRFCFGSPCRRDRARASRPWRYQSHVTSQPRRANKRSPRKKMRSRSRHRARPRPHVAMSLLRPLPKCERISGFALMVSGVARSVRARCRTGSG